MEPPCCQAISLAPCFGHLERLGVAEVDLLLPLAPLALGELHGHPRRLHAVADGAHERLFLGRLEDVVVLEIARHGRQAVVALRARLVEGLAEEIQLELGGRLHGEAAPACPLELPLEHPARRLLDGLSFLGVHVAEDEGRLGEPRQEPPRPQIRHHLHVAIATLPRREREARERLHLHVHREEVDAGVDAVLQHVVEEVPADHALAHEPSHAVGEHREHGVHLALADERVESFGISLVGQRISSGWNEPGAIGEGREADES